MFAANDANKEERAESLEIINENHSLIESKIAGLSGSLNKAKAKQLLKEFETQYASYSITEAEIIQKIKSGNSSDNLSSLMDDQREKRTKVISTMDEFKDYQEGVMKDTLSNTKQTYEDMIGFVIFCGYSQHFGHFRNGCLDDSEHIERSAIDYEGHQKYRF
ncbi:MCP four helix bundle domain-containing protein [Peribacillus frigoritolerans]|nr:MCP four helix bundle domain-containing protein [Peribacillus frigoritolerans]